MTTLKVSLLLILCSCSHPKYYRRVLDVDNCKWVGSDDIVSGSVWTSCPAGKEGPKNVVTSYSCYCPFKKVYVNPDEVEVYDN